MRVKVTLRWPTSLAINAVDQSVYIVDRDVIVQLSADHTVRVLVAAASTPCVYLTQPRPVIVSWQHGPPTDVAVTPSGRQLVIADRQALRAVHLLTGHVTLYDRHTVTLSHNASLSAVSINHDGVIFVADVSNANVYAVTSHLPAPNHVTGNYDVIDRITQQRYTFNRSVNVDCFAMFSLSSFGDITLTKTSNSLFYDSRTLKYTTANVTSSEVITPYRTLRVSMR